MLFDFTKLTSILLIIYKKYTRTFLFIYFLAETFAHKKKNAYLCNPELYLDSKDETNYKCMVVANSGLKKS